MARERKKLKRFLIASVSAVMFLTIFYSSERETQEEAPSGFHSSTHRPPSVQEISNSAVPYQRRPKDAPKVVILWTTWRSGSNHIGELLENAVPKTFYSNEPVHWIGVKILHQSSDETYQARIFLQDLLHCRLSSSYKNILTYMSHQLFYQIWNPYLIENCKTKDLCDDPVYVSKMCRGANLHSVKVIRLSLKWAWSLLQDEELDLQIIYLVRDPRATLASRGHVTFCDDITCKDPKKVCELLEDDLMGASKMQEAFPHRFKLVQYEQFNRDAERGLRDLMSFIGFPSLSQTQLDLLHPKTLNPDDLFATNKNSSMMIDRWRTNTNFKNVQDVQKTCAKPISRLGLRVFSTESEFRNLSLPLLVSNPVQ